MTETDHTVTRCHTLHKADEGLLFLQWRQSSLKHCSHCALTGKYEWCYFNKTGQAALSKTHSDHRCSKASFQSGALQRVLRKYWVLNSRSEMIAFRHRRICLFSISFFPFFLKCAHWQSYSAYRTSPAMLIINNRKCPVDVTWSVSALSSCVVAVKQRDSSVVKWTVSTLRTLFQGLNYGDVLLFIDLF